MGDALVDQAKNLRMRCTRCGGRKFRVTLEGDAYTVDLEEGYSAPALDSGCRAITEMVCTACCRRVKIQ